MQGIVKASGDFCIDVDDKRCVHALCAQHDLVKIARCENVEIFLELCNHQCQQMSRAMIGEVFAEFFHAPLFVFALDDGAFIDTNTNWNSSFLACIDHRVHLITITDISRIESNLVHTSFDCFKSALIMKVNICNDGDFHLWDD